MKEVRIGVIGVGGMGGIHASQLQGSNIRGGRLAAVCDMVPDAIKDFDPGIRRFTDSRKLIRSDEVDAVIIATPHYDHTITGSLALKQGLHVLVEKPISAHKADCERLIAAHKSRKQVFAAMFQLRTAPLYRKIKQLIDDGTLGKLHRVTWIVTDWFRSEAYYSSGGWRATWAGEGGGVLLNQCPHQLDLYQWLFGMPVRISAFCSIGKRHKIEVEDEATAFMEHPRGLTGVFITSTGEAPGTNRLEIAADNGKVVVEHNKLTFVRNEIPAARFSKTTRERFAIPPVWSIDIPVDEQTEPHRQVIANFVDAILTGAPLIAPARQGINSVELANAMLESSFLGKPVDLPLDGRAFQRRLKKLIRESTFVKKTSKRRTNAKDQASSFHA